MNIFQSNVDFYPTPKKVVERMLMGEDIAGKTVLEPSAGKGDICDVLREYGASNILVCENDEHNQKLLNGKYDEFLADDFLTVTSEQVSHVNMIVMNPPFSKGMEHILHAFEIAPPGCVVISLCNNDNLSVRYTKNDRLNEIIADHGQSEGLGSVFDTAERRTDVDVALIKLYKPGEADNEFDGYMFEQIDSDALNGSRQEGLMSYNCIRDLVNRYVSAVKLFDDTLKAAKRINETAMYSEPEVRDENGEVIKRAYHSSIPITFRAVYSNGNKTYAEITHNVYKKALQKHYWHIIFDKLNMEKYATKSLREQINKFIEQQVNVPFTMHNIYKVIDMVIQTNGQRMHKALEEAFDKVCSLSAQNSTAGEKWKTNSNYMVNKRFIVDYITDAYNWRGSSKPHVHVNYSDGGNSGVIDDLVKALCWLTGINYNTVGSLYYHCNTHQEEWGKWFRWGFFKVRAYKKGTCHFEFIDENTWAKFNQEVAKTKGWKLGSKEKKKPRTKKEQKEATTVPEESSSGYIEKMDVMPECYQELRKKYPSRLLVFSPVEGGNRYLAYGKDALKLSGDMTGYWYLFKDGRGYPVAYCEDTQIGRFKDMTAQYKDLENVIFIDFIDKNHYKTHWYQFGVKSEKIIDMVGLPEVNKLPNGFFAVRDKYEKDIILQKREKDSRMIAYAHHARRIVGKWLKDSRLRWHEEYNIEVAFVQSYYLVGTRYLQETLEKIGSIVIVDSDFKPIVRHSLVEGKPVTTDLAIVSDNLADSQESPILQRYHTCKEKYKRDGVCPLIILRCGDFYESYDDDAAILAKVLGITLTRQNCEDGIRMAGFPYHALDTYLPKLIRAGHKVVICDKEEVVGPLVSTTTVPSEPSLFDML